MAWTSPISSDESSGLLEGGKWKARSLHTLHLDDINQYAPPIASPLPAVLNTHRPSATHRATRTSAERVHCMGLLTLRCAGITIPARL